MKKTQFRERELDLVDLFWKLLEQWKCIVIVALVVALAISAAMTIKSNRDAKKKSEVDPDVLNALSIYADYMAKREYYNSNFFNNVDLNDCVTVTCLYEYNPAVKNYNGDDEGTLALLNNLYNLILSDNTFRTEMIEELKKYWPKIDSDTLGNVMNFSAFHVAVYGPGTITFNVVIPKQADPEEVQKVLTASVYAYHDRISPGVSQPNTVKFVNFAFKQTDYTAELSARNTRYNLVSAGNSQYNAAYKALSDNNQKTVDEVIEKCGNSSDPAVYEEYLAKKAKSSILTPKSALKKYGILGLLVGIALYAFIYIVYIILIKRIRSEYDLENAVGVRNFGGIYEYPYTGMIGKFLHGRKVYAFRTKNGKNIGRISDDIRCKLEFADKKAYTLVSLGKLSDKTKAINDEQIRIMKENGITVETLNIENGVDSFEDTVYKSLGSVVIELLGERTKWDDLTNLYYKLKEYDVDMIGSEYVEA